MIGARRESAFVVVFAAVMASLTACAASTWYVSTSGNDSNSGKTSSAALKTIQKAVDKASANDTILVANGTYDKIVVPVSKAPLQIKSINGATVTTIQGASNGSRCAVLGDGTTYDIKLTGFTLYRGNGGYNGFNDDGGAVFGGSIINCIVRESRCWETGGSVIRKCRVEDCNIYSNGLGLSNPYTKANYVLQECVVIRSNIHDNEGCGAANSVLSDCEIKNNVSESIRGAGANHCTLTNCVVSGNTATATGGGYSYGGGLYDSTAHNCVIAKNSASHGGGINGGAAYNCTIVDNTRVYSNSGSSVEGATLYNCIIMGYESSWKYKISNSTAYKCLFWNMQVDSNVTKNSVMEKNPLLVSTTSYSLSASSPCIDAGNNAYVNTEYDIAGNVRVCNNCVDIGAYEYQTPAFSVKTISGLQRYPWNGLVDVQFRFTEANNNSGQVSLSAKDIVGNTNLSMRTIYKSNGTAVNTAGESLSPGTYKWVWDAAADLPKDFKRDRVTVSVKVSNVTGTSGEFRVDLAGMGPWGMRTAAASEAISYSTAWATNLTAAQQASANAVVKVWPVKREKPKYIAIDLSGGTAATHYPIEYLDEIPGGTWSDEYKTSKLVLRHIPAGSFIMGGRATDYPGAVNTNLHMVTLTRDFYMGVFEVTQRQWELVMGNRPSQFTNESCYATRPVDKVSYLDIRGSVRGRLWPTVSDCDDNSFIGVLSAKSGMSDFDLPTDAQWEYACRAGTTTALNIGKDISSAYDVHECPELMTNARFTGNSNNSNMTNPERFACTDEYCSAKVGSYTPNAWGLYDMHGNLWELCLDRATWLPVGSVDPVGTDDSSITKRVIRGGGYNELAWRCRSGFRYSDNGGMGYLQTGRGGTVGFRLCLQGGELPELMNDSTVLINEAGSGTANWTPTKAGTYYLTHETQTNGVNGAEVLGAWFTVAGPELTFAPDGDLTPGVKIAINGAGEGWHIYYTMDGSVPTQSSASEYSGPITLNDSTTIRAIAFSDGGMESREFSATYSLMSVVGAVAKPRYPWNGKVDIDCEVKGDANLEYLVSLAALDLDGNTNLPVRTVVGRAVPSEPQSQANEFVFGGRGATALSPGTYRFTWDADADIAGDFDFANVAVKVSAANTAITGAKRTVTFTVDGYTGTEVLTNVPVLVRLSTAIEGFSYADFADADGGDMVFCDEGESVIYPHEIDEWHVGGESLVWVKLPTMAKGTRFKMAYGNQKLETRNQKLSPHEVWRDYAGVWHMNEDSGTAYDSTANALDALPSCGTNTLADISQMVAYEDGACGRARVNATEGIMSGNYLSVPAYDGLSLAGSFMVSIWWRMEGTNGFPRVLSRKTVFNSNNGWELHYENNQVSQGGVRGAADTKVVFMTPSAKWNWVYLTYGFNEESFSVFTNGAPCASGTITPATDNALSLSIGNNSNGSERSHWGQYDEIRLRGGSLSAARIKADYDMIKNRNFLTYGPVESGRGNQDSNGNSAGGGQPVVVPLAAPANVLENSRQVECTDLVWDAVPGATGYEIWVSATPNGTIDDAVKILTVTEPSFFDDDHTYAPARHNIWIRAVDDHGNVSAFVGPFNVGKFVS